jgi:SPP1 family predicted phage head-tail adaptor
MKPNKVGTFRQRVVLQDIPETSQDFYGQPSLAATEIGRFWAEVTPLRGDEMLNVRQVWPTATHKVRMRWIGTRITPSPTNPAGVILPRMRLQVLSDGTFLNIVFADNIEKRNRIWELTCEEKVET